MALGSTQRVTEMSTRILPWEGGGKGLPSCKAGNLAAISESIVRKMLEPRRLTSPRPVTGIDYLLPYSYRRPHV
jgi:hypothetical protein